VYDTILEVSHLTKSYTKKKHLFSKNELKTVLHDLSFKVEQGKTLALVGESGSGKSTLARILAGIETEFEGEVLIDDISLKSQDNDEQKLLRQKARLIFQNPYASLNPRMRIGKQLEEPLLINTTLTAKQRKQLIHETILRVGLRPEQLTRYPSMFSGGQRQRIAIAHALILAPQLVIADEPLSALDVSVQAQILNLLTDLQDDMGLSYIFITHDLSVVKYISDEVLVLYNGHVMEYGQSNAIFKQPKHPYTKAIIESSHHLHNQKIEDITLEKSFSNEANLIGCPYESRCKEAITRCKTEAPARRQVQDRLIACHLVE
jgi:dipeptide transport system ATP-binding protein